MVGVTGLLVGYILGQLFPNTFAPGYPSPDLHVRVLRHLRHRRVVHRLPRRRRHDGRERGHQRGPDHRPDHLSIMAIAHRAKHPEGSNAWVLDSTGTPTEFVQKVDDKGVPVVDKDGAAVLTDQKVTISYKNGITKDEKTGIETYNYHESAKSVISPHGFGYVVIQACVAILILVGFESVTAMGEEAKNAKRDIPKAVILSLLIQGGFCYLLEYFAANYFLHSGYQATVNASASSAPIGDMMQLVGAWALAVQGRLVVHDGPGLHGFPGPDRHHTELSEHRRPRDLRHGPRQ